MLAVYLVLLACTMAPVIALQLGADASVLVWMVFILVVIKAVLLVDHFMEMRYAPRGWRLATQGWAIVIIAALAVIRGIH
jgi:heme/copper-type cytochrome/quinol oxidase subunit 4